MADPLLDWVTVGATAVPNWAAKAIDWISYYPGGGFLKTEEALAKEREYYYKDIPSIPGPTYPSSPSTIEQMEGNWTSEQALSQAWSQQQQEWRDFFSNVGSNLEESKVESNKWFWTILAIVGGVIVIRKF